MTGRTATMERRSRTAGAGPGALLLVLALAAVSPCEGPWAREAGRPAPWAVWVPKTGILVIEPPPGWNAASPQVAEALVEWRATTKSRCEMVIRVTASPQPDPAFNGPEALRAAVRRQAEALMPHVVESRYTLRELRGSEAGGFYFALRERAPRRRQAAYMTRGIVGLGNLRIDFALTSPTPAPAEVRDALVRIAASRIVRPAPEGETP